MRRNLSKVALVLSATMLSCGHAAASELKPFKSDGCSAFPDGTPKQQDLWLKCCYAHDLDYWMGGSYGQRKASDQRLAQCVAQVGQPAIAKAMLAGVRVGGSPFWPTSFRWGYGWPYFRGYKALTDEELELVKARLKEKGAAEFHRTN